MFLKLSGIVKKYADGSRGDITPVNGVDIEIERGDSIAILGTSGVGKTTLLNIIGCVDKATKGKYYIDGEDVSNFSDKRMSYLRNKMFGYVIQDFCLIEYRTVYENVSVPLLFNKDIKTKDVKTRVNQVLEKVGIRELSHKKVWELSGGQKQRVAIARALVNNGEVILADEPTGALDQENKEKIMEILKMLNDNGTTIICVTHDKEVAAYCKRVYVMNNGNLLSESE